MLRDVNMKYEKYCHDQEPPSEKWFLTSFITFDSYI